MFKVIVVSCIMILRLLMHLKVKFESYDYLVGFVLA